MKTQNNLLRLGLVLAFMLSFGLSSTAFAQKTWVGGTDNNWTTGANWDPAGVPAGTDNVEIPAGSYVIVDGASTCENLLINEYARVVDGTGTLTVEGDITFSGEGQRKIDNVNLTFAEDAATINLTRDNELVALDFDYNGLDVAISGSFEFTINGDIINTAGGAGSITTNAATTNATLLFNGAAIDADGGGTAALAFNTPGIIDMVINTTVAITAVAVTDIDFNNLTLLDNSNVTTAGGGVSGFDVYGDINVVGNGSFTGAVADDDPIVFQGTSVINVSPQGTLEFDLLNLAATADVTVNGDIEISATGVGTELNLADGAIFVQNSGTTTFSGAVGVIVNANTTTPADRCVFYNLSHTGATSITLTVGDAITIAGNLSSGAGNFVATGAGTEVIFNNTASRENPRTITNTGGTVDFENFTVAANSHVTTAASFSYAVVGAASFTVNSGASFVATAGAVDATGAGGAGTIVNEGYLEFFDYNNTLDAGVLTAGDEMVVANDLIVTAGSFTGGLDSKVIMTGAAPGAVTITAGTLTLYNLEISDGANVIQGAANALTINDAGGTTAGITVLGDGQYSVAAGGTVLFDGGGASGQNTTISVSEAGSLTLDIVTLQNNAEVVTADDFTVSGILTTVAGTSIIASFPSTITISAAAAAVTPVTNAAAELQFYNLAITGSIAPATSFQVAGNFEVATAAIFAPTANGVEFIGGTTKEIINNGTLNFLNLTIADVANNIVTTKSDFGIAATGIFTVGSSSTSGAFIAEEGTVTIAGGAIASTVTQGTTEANAEAMQFFNLNIDVATPATPFVVKGDFVTSAAFAPAAGHTLYLKGSTPQEYNDANTSAMRDIVLNNPTGLKLLSDMTTIGGTANTLTLTSGDIDLNGDNNIIFGDDGDALVETTGNVVKNTGQRTNPGQDGYVQITKATGTSITALGATFTFDAVSGAAIIRRYHHALDVGNDKISALRFYAVDHATNNLTDVSINFDNTEIIGDASSYDIYTIANQDPTLAFATAYTTRVATPSIGAGTSSIVNDAAFAIGVPANFAIIAIAADNFDTFDNGGGDNLWTNSANWVDGTVPTANDHVIILPGQIAELPIGAAKQAKSLTIGLPGNAAVTQVRPVIGDTTAIQIGGDIIIPHGATASGFRGSNNTGRLNTIIDAAGVGVKFFPTVSASGLVGLNFNNLSITNTSVSYLGDYNIAIAGDFGITGASGSWVADNPSNGTTLFNGQKAQTISVDDLSFGQFVNLTLAGAGTAVTTDADLNVRGTITTPTNTSFTANDGDITLDPARSGLTGWASDNAANPNLTFYNLFVSGGLNLAPTSSANIAADFVKSGNGNFTSGVLRFNNSSFSAEDLIVSGLGDVTFGTLLFPNGSNVETSNNFAANTITVEGAGSFVATNGTIDNQGGTITKSGQGTLEFFNLDVTGTSTTASDFTVKGNMRVLGAGDFQAGDGTITFNNEIPKEIRNDNVLIFHRLAVADDSDLSTNSLGDDFTIGDASGTTTQGIEVGTGASFTMGSGVATFASAVNKEIVNNGTLEFYDITLADAAMTITSDDDFTVKGGTLTFGIDANAINTFTMNDGTVTFDRTPADATLEDNTVTLVVGDNDPTTFNNVIFANSTDANLTTGDDIVVNGDFTVNNSSNFAAADGGLVTFSGSATQAIGGNSTFATPIAFSELTINNTNNVTMSIDVEVANTGASELTLTNGALNIGSNTLRLGAATMARTNGTINGASGTLELIDGLGATNLLTDALFASTLWNLTVSDAQDTEGNLTVNGNLVLNDWLDIQADELTVFGNLTQSDVNQRFTLGTTGKLILDGSGSTVGLSNRYFDGMSVNDIEIKRNETLLGDLDIEGEFRLNSGVQELSTSSFDLTFLNNSTIVLESGQINAQTGSAIYMEASYTEVPLNLFANNTVDDFVTFGAITLGGDHKVEDDFAQVGGPYDVTTTEKNILTLGANATLTNAFDEDNHVIGNLRRTVTNTATPYNVGGGTAATYRPLTLQFANIGSSQDVLLSANPIDPVFTRAGMVDNSVNVTWELEAEGTAPMDSLRMTLQWNTGDEDITPEDAGTEIGNGAFITMWDDQNNEWVSFRSSTGDADNDAIFDFGPARVLNFNAGEFPIMPSMLTGDWAAFIVDKDAQPDISGEWTDLSAAPWNWTLDTLKDRAIRNTVNKVAITEISPEAPIASGSAFSVVVELQNEFGEPITNTTGNPFAVEVSLNLDGGGAFIQPPNGIIPVGASSITMSGFAITNAAGASEYQLKADTAAPKAINVDATTLDLTSDRWLAGLSEKFSVIGNDPVAQASNLLFSNVTNTSMTVSWAAVGNTILVARAVDPITDEPIDGTTYFANSIFGLGSTIGDGVVVYKGSGNSVDVTGLSPSTQYFFQAYSYTGTDGNENYLTEVAAANNPRTQATTPVVASIDDDVTLGANDTRLTSKTVGTNSPFLGSIRSSGDIDWFNFKVSNISPNVRVKLYELPGDYNIEIYNSAQRRVRRATLAGDSNEAFVINELTPGTYTIRIFGVNGANDDVNPYTLLITTRENEIFSVTP